MSVRQLSYLALLILGVMPSMSANIVPKPKDASFPPMAGQVLPEGSVAIVIGEKATEPEKYAARTLQRAVRLRFHREWPICLESEKLLPTDFRIVLGQKSTCKLIQRHWKHTFPPLKEFQDAFGVDTSADGIAIVGGTNPRSVIFGQDVLFQLLSQKNDKLVLTRASIRDWASIPYRGRPHTWNAQYLRPGVMDAYARARINWIDLRGPAGQYGYDPKQPIDRDIAAQVLHEAHMRGMFVYATVNCAVPQEDFDAVIKTYEDLIALGADGVYISIDDPGADTRFGTSIPLLKRILALAKKHGMTGYKIAIVPGKESYRQILTDTNRRVAQLPEMKDALWYVTPTPSDQNVADMKAIGVNTKPCWWHNWPRPAGGFTHGGYGGGSQRVTGGAYMEVPPLSEGWGAASFEKLSKAASQIDGVMPWGGSGWGPEYTSHVIGWWAWDPQSFDFTDTRRRIYDIVWGPGQVQNAFRFDDLLVSLKSLLVRAGTGVDEVPGYDVNALWPPRFRSSSDRQQARKLIAEMDELLKPMLANAPKETLTDPEEFELFYGDPAPAQVAVARVVASLDYPEYWWRAHEERVLKAVRIGDLQLAAQWEAEAKEKALTQAENVRNALKPYLVGLDPYVDGWKARYEPVPEARISARGPELRGDLSDPLWQSALRLPLQGGSHGTDVLVIYTSDTLHVGFSCIEPSPDRMLKAHTTRDSMVWEDDSVEVVIDTGCLRDMHYQFIVNAVGAMFDGRQLPGEEFDSAWNGEWQAKASVAADRWTAEFAVPWKTLGLESSPQGRFMLFNFARSDFAGGRSVMGDTFEITTWSGGGSMHDPSKYRPIRLR